MMTGVLSMGVGKETGGRSGCVTTAVVSTVMSVVASTGGGRVMSEVV